MSELSNYGRHYLFFVMVGALFMLASPAFSQEPAECSGWDWPAISAQDKPASQAAAQTSSQNQSGDDQKDKEEGKKKSDRMFFVMPNFLTVENEAKVPPIHWKEKFAITAKGAFDPYEFTIVGVLAGIRQAEDAYPAFGQGFGAYGKRYGTAFADQVDGNIMVGAVFPSLMKTDPRYFQLGKGGFFRRFGYAISRIFVTRRDSGANLFNFPEFAGNASAIAISNVYYPAADRGFTSGLNNWGLQMGVDAFGNELKEFWPDIHKHFSRKKSAPPRTPASD